MKKLQGLQFLRGKGDEWVYSWPKEGGEEDNETIFQLTPHRCSSLFWMTIEVRPFTKGPLHESKRAKV